MAKKNDLINDTSGTPLTLKERIGAFVRDTVTLDVLTLSGDITLINDEAVYDEKNQEFDWDTLFGKITARMKASGENRLEVVAYTHAEWDLDEVTFVKKEISESQKELLNAHRAAVAAAQKSRFEAVRIVAGLVGVYFKPDSTT